MLHLFFNKYNDLKEADITVKRSAGKYLWGKEGYIRHIYQKHGHYMGEVRILLEDQHYYTFDLSTSDFFLSEPSGYPKLPIDNNLPEKLNKRGGGIRMMRMPRLFAWLMWSALVVLVWHGVNHIDQIANFFVHLVVHR